MTTRITVTALRKTATALWNQGFSVPEIAADLAANDIAMDADAEFEIAELLEADGVHPFGADGNWLPSRRELAAELCAAAIQQKEHGE